MRTTAPIKSAHEGQCAHYHAQAAQWLAAGRPDHAAHLYALVLDLRPGDTRTRMMLANLLVRAGEHASAADHYLQIALDFAARRRDQEALAICYQVIHLEPSRFVYVAVAEMLRRIGRQARPLCAKAAEAHLAANRLADGLHMLRLGAELDRNNPSVHRRLAQIFLSQHMIRDALVHLVEAGRLLRAAGNNAEYIEVAKLVLKYDPRHLETLRELPRVYLCVGEPQRAVTKLSDLMRVSPGDTAGFEILAHAFAVIGRTTTSLSILERLVGELVDTHRQPQTEAILERAQRWRLDDAPFIRAVQALRGAKRAPAPEAEAAPFNPNATVVLDIADLVIPEPGAEEIIDLSEELVELSDGEGTLVVRLQDFSPSAPSKHAALIEGIDDPDIEDDAPQVLTEAPTQPLPEAPRSMARRPVRSSAPPARRPVPAYHRTARRV